jgi:DNA-binding LytR/AlgR family response regulator
MSDEEIIRMLSDTVRHLKERKPELCLPVYQGKDFISLSVDDITYIARNRGYCNVFLSEYAREKYNTDHMTARQSLSELQTLLIPYHFSLPHNSYLVNLRYVWKSNYTTVVLQDKTELNISRSKVKKFREDILEYSTEKYRTGRL